MFCIEHLHCYICGHVSLTNAFHASPPPTPHPTDCKWSGRVWLCDQGFESCVCPLCGSKWTSSCCRTDGNASCVGVWLNHLQQFNVIPPGDEGDELLLVYYTYYIYYAIEDVCRYYVCVYVCVCVCVCVCVHKQKYLHIHYMCTWFWNSFCWKYVVLIDKYCN